MVKYKMEYARFFGLGDQDRPICEVCNKSEAVDIHHLIYRSEGGGDGVENTIGVCRKCHDKFHLGILDRHKWLEYAHDLKFRKDRMSKRMFMI